MTSKKQGWDFAADQYNVKRTLRRKNQVNPYNWKSLLGQTNSTKPLQRHMRYKPDVNPLREEENVQSVEPTPGRKVELLKKYYKEKLVEVTNAAYAFDPISQAPVGYRDWINKQVEKGRLKELPRAGSKEDNSFRLRYVSLLENKANAYGQIIAQLSTSGAPEQVLDAYLRGFHSFLRGRPTEAAQAKLKRLGMKPTFEPFRDESVQQYLKAFSRVKKEYYEDLAMLRMNGPTGGIRNIELYYKYLVDGAEDEKIERNLWDWLEGGKLGKYAARIAGGSHDSLVNQLSAEFPVSGQTKAIPFSQSNPAPGRTADDYYPSDTDSDDDDDDKPKPPPPENPKKDDDDDFSMFEDPAAAQADTPPPGSVVDQPKPDDAAMRADYFGKYLRDEPVNVMTLTGSASMIAHLGCLDDKFTPLRYVKAELDMVEIKRDSNVADWKEFDHIEYANRLQQALDLECDLTDDQKALFAEQVQAQQARLQALADEAGAAPVPASVAIDAEPGDAPEPTFTAAARAPAKKEPTDLRKRGEAPRPIAGKRKAAGAADGEDKAKVRQVENPYTLQKNEELEKTAKKQAEEARRAKDLVRIHTEKAREMRAKYNQDKASMTEAERQRYERLMQETDARVSQHAQEAAQAKRERDETMQNARAALEHHQGRINELEAGRAADRQLYETALAEEKRKQLDRLSATANAHRDYQAAMKQLAEAKDADSAKAIRAEVEQHRATIDRANQLLAATGAEIKRLQDSEAAKNRELEAERANRMRAAQMIEAMDAEIRKTKQDAQDTMLQMSQHIRQKEAENARTQKLLADVDAEKQRLAAAYTQQQQEKKTAIEALMGEITRISNTAKADMDVQKSAQLKALVEERGRLERENGELVNQMLAAQQKVQERFDRARLAQIRKAKERYSTEQALSAIKGGGSIEHRSASEIVEYEKTKSEMMNLATAVRAGNEYYIRNIAEEEGIDLANLTADEAVEAIFEAMGWDDDEADKIKAQARRNELMAANFNFRDDVYSRSFPLGDKDPWFQQIIV